MLTLCSEEKWRDWSYKMQAMWVSNEFGSVFCAAVEGNVSKSDINVGVDRVAPESPNFTLIATPALSYSDPVTVTNDVIAFVVGAFAATSCPYDADSEPG